MTMPVFPDHIYIYFECKQFNGVPINRETNQCDDIQFFNIKDLPPNIIEADRKALSSIYNQNQNFATFGYEK